MRYLLLGDSHAAGAPGRSLEAALRARGHEVRRWGEPGEGIVSWYAHRRAAVQSLVRRFEPQRLILLFGSNDAADHPAFVRAASWFATGGAYYSGPPAYAAPDLRGRGFAVRRRARELFGRRYLDVWDATDDERLYVRDGVHLNADGGDAWAHAVLEQLPGVQWRLWALLAATAAAFGLWRAS